MIPLYLSAVFITYCPQTKVQAASLTAASLNLAHSALCRIWQNANVLNCCEFTSSSSLHFVLIQGVWGSRRWGRSSCMGSPSWVWRTLSISFTLPKSAWTWVISRIPWRRPTSCRLCLFWGSATSYWAARWEAFGFLARCHCRMLQELINGRLSGGPAH